MNRRKDRDRWLAMKDQNPDYRGFRGSGQESSGASTAPLQAVSCSICGRRRNVAMSIAQEQGDNYVCLSCQEAEGEEVQEPEGEG